MGAMIIEHNGPYVASLIFEKNENIYRRNALNE